jgi:hypothetical protein
MEAKKNDKQSIASKTNYKEIHIYVVRRGICRFRVLYQMYVLYIPQTLEIIGVSFIVLFCMQISIMYH